MCTEHHKAELRKMEKQLPVDLGDAVLRQRIEEWLAWDRYPPTRDDILRLIREKRVDELNERLHERLEFGTAGIRGNMGAGFNHMNDLVIIQTGQGLAKYLLKTIPDVKQRGVVIGFDNRHNSSRFAQLTAAVFLSVSIPVSLFSKMCPTPFVPYTLLKLHCSAGIMITASHNPKEDNGYKVYWDNGAQIISPHDKGIATAISENLVPWDASWKIVSNHPLLKDPLAEMMASYVEQLGTVCLYRELNKHTPLKFVYTPMHGVGQAYITEAVKTFGFRPFISVEEQKEPDPEFPTVKYPNPEEGKQALDLAVATAEKHNVKIILANDPDADRFALAQKLENGSWKIFSGNEIGALLGWWKWHCHQEKHGFNVNASDCYMIASTVSSKMLRAVGAAEGFHFEETLTGFKWIANRADVLRQEKKTVLFGFEEAIGFMCTDFVLDKDGISACLIAAEMAVWLEKQGSTFDHQLNKLHEKYGYHGSNNSYFLCHHPPTIEAIFKRLRNFDGPNTYPKTCGRFHVKNVRDLTAGYDNNQPENKPILPTSNSSQMITFTFEEGIVATLRTSGTEPKLKYYTEICGRPGKGTKDSLDRELQELVDLLVSEFLQPEKHDIHAKAD